MKENALDRFRRSELNRIRKALYSHGFTLEPDGSMTRNMTGCLFSKIALDSYKSYNHFISEYPCYKVLPNDNRTPYEEMLDAVIDARENSPTAIPKPTIHFTPGVPTEDGWYVVRVSDVNGAYYDVARVQNRVCDRCRFNILSHAKLPEL
jgi:hypothetical protein